MTLNTEKLIINLKTVETINDLSFIRNIAIRYAQYEIVVVVVVLPDPSEG